jgi:chromosome partitioning protein
MRRVISIGQLKGGVGKTTLAVCVAGELKARGHDVALIDADPRCSASRWADPGKLDFPVSQLVLGEHSVLTWAREVRRTKADYVVIDTAPNDRSLGYAGAISDLVLVPCTPSGLDLDATVGTLKIVDAVRIRPDGVPRLILIPNRVNRRTLEGQQLGDELTTFGEHVSAPIGDRTAFIRAFSSGLPISKWAGPAAYGEIRSLTDLVERFLNSAPVKVR